MLALLAVLRWWEGVAVLYAAALPPLLLPPPEDESIGWGGVALFYSAALPPFLLPPPEDESIERLKERIRGARSFQAVRPSVVGRRGVLRT